MTMTKMNMTAAMKENCLWTHKK